ncbi:hypothetical protein ACYF6T_39105 [Streptomyces sp. 7R007]
MSPRPEATAAANWWADKLAGPARHDVGSGAEESSAIANTMSALVQRQRSQAQIDAFREALAEDIEQHLGTYGWLPDHPEFGSYMRAVMVDYGPDPVLAGAAEKAGFELRTLDLPMKTVMWINPGIVKVSEGHSAKPVVIWRARPVSPCSEAFAGAAAAGPPRCPGCGHAPHAPGSECEAGVDHGTKRWHRCLCLATPGASRACPPQMDCQGGKLGYSDVWHLRQGRSLRGADGETITQDVLAEPQPIVLARAVRTCTAIPSQWNAWTTDGQYLYLRYRSGIGTVDAYDTEDSAQWTRVPDGAVARFDTGDRWDGEMDLTEFCEHTGLQLADDAEVIGE